LPLSSSELDLCSLYDVLGLSWVAFILSCYFYYCTSSNFFFCSLAHWFRLEYETEVAAWPKGTLSLLLCSLIHSLASRPHDFNARSTTYSWHVKEINHWFCSYVFFNSIGFIVFFPPSLSFFFLFVFPSFFHFFIFIFIFFLSFFLFNFLLFFIIFYFYLFIYFFILFHSFSSSPKLTSRWAQRILLSEWHSSCLWVVDQTRTTTHRIGSETRWRRHGYFYLCIFYYLSSFIKFIYFVIYFCLPSFILDLFLYAYQFRFPIPFDLMQ
jgi:hypothetical protein